MTAEVRDVAVSGVKAISFDCYEGSYVFFDNGKRNFYKEWNELTPTQQQAFIKTRNTLEAAVNNANRELTATLKHVRTGLEVLTSL